MKKNLLWVGFIAITGSMLSSCFPSFQGGSPTNAFISSPYERQTLKMYPGETWFVSLEAPAGIVEDATWKEMFKGFHDYYTIRAGESHSVGVGWLSLRNTEAPDKWKFAINGQEATEKIESIKSSSITEIWYQTSRKLNVVFSINIPKDAALGEYDLLGQLASNADKSKTMDVRFHVAVGERPKQ